MGPQAKHVLPKISIITVCYNSMSGNYNVERTIKSVLGQNYKNLEYIVIDGLSKDNTLEIIKKYSKTGFANRKIAKWLSEKDLGMYDALNKGIKLASGDILCCLNSDDFFYDSDVVSKIAQVFTTSNSFDLIYADILKAIPSVKSKNNAFLLSSPEFSLGNLKKGIQIYHPAAFIAKKAILDVGGFNLDYKSASDLDFFCKLAKNGVKSKYLPTISTVFLEGGISNEEKSHLEAISIVTKHFGFISSFPLYIKHYLVRVYWLILFVVQMDTSFKKVKLDNKFRQCDYQVSI